MGRWDLHVHTRWSDGSMPVDEVVEYASRIGLSGIAITDHDSMDMIFPAKEKAKAIGIDIVDGVELSAIDSKTGRKVHLLVYYPKKIEPLQPLFNYISDNRRAAGEKMIEQLMRRYPITRRMVLRQAESSQTIYKVHLMRALMEMGYTLTIYGELYNELFGKGGSCISVVEYKDVFEVAKAARQSQGVVILAHPCVYDSFDVAERLARAGLIDGIENNYPRKRAETIPLHERLIREYSLITTGGTDYHGYYTTFSNPLGSGITTEKEMAELKNILSKKEN